MASEEEQLTFDQVVSECARTPDLVREFDRLYGTALSKPRSPIERMVDEATGFHRDQLARFVAFVYRFVWIPLGGHPLPEPPKP